MNKINDLSDTEALALIQTLAAVKPDYFNFTTEAASLLKLEIPPIEQSQLVYETLTILVTDLKQASIIQDIVNNSPPQKFDQKRSNIPALIAIILVLGIQIEYKQKVDGSEMFHFKYDAGNEAIVQLIKKLERFLGKT